MVDLGAWNDHTKQDNIVMMVSFLAVLAIWTMTLACYQLITEDISITAGAHPSDDISDALLLTPTPRLEAQLRAQHWSSSTLKATDAEPLLGDNSVPSDSKDAPVDVVGSPRSRYRLEGIVAARKATRARRWCGIVMCFTKLSQRVEAAEATGDSSMYYDTGGGLIEAGVVRLIVVSRALSRWAERTSPVQLIRLLQTRFLSWMPTISRIFGILLFYADLASDIVVCMLLLRGGQLIMGYLSALCTTMQFWMTSQIVNQYLDEAKMTFPDSTGWFRFLVRAHRILGNGLLGTLFLDVAMIFEPMTKQVLAALHLSRDAANVVAEFLPAYVSSRTLIAGTVEAIPLAILQTWLLYDAIHPFSSDRSTIERSSPGVGILSLSVSLSMINFIFTWMCAMSVAKESRIRLFPYLKQIARVGSGLPVDAIVGNTLVSWRLLNYDLQANDKTRLLESLSSNRSLLELDLRALQRDDPSLLIPTDLYDWYDLAQSLQMQVHLRKSSMARQLKTLVLWSWEIPVDLLTQHNGERLCLSFANADAAVDSTDHDVLLSTKRWLGHRQHPDGRCLTSNGTVVNGMAPIDAFIVGRMLAACDPGDLEGLKLVSLYVPVRRLLQDSKVLYDQRLCDWGTNDRQLSDHSSPMWEGPHPLEVLLMAALILPSPNDKSQEKDEAHRTLLEEMSTQQCNRTHLLALDHSLRRAISLGIDARVLCEATERFVHKKKQFALLRNVEHQALLEGGAEPPQHDLHKVAYNLPQLRVALHEAGCADLLGRSRDSSNPVLSSIDMLVNSVSSSTQLRPIQSGASIPLDHLELPISVYRRALFLRRVKDECLRPYRKGWDSDAHADDHALQLPLENEDQVRAAHACIPLGDQSSPHEWADTQLQLGYGQRGKLMQLLDLDVEKLERAIAVALQANVAQSQLKAELQLFELARVVQAMQRAAVQMRKEMTRISKLRDPHPPLHEMKAPMDALLSAIDAARATKQLDSIPTLFFNRDYQVARKLLEVFENESGDFRELFPKREALRRSLVSASKMQLAGIDAIPAVPKEHLAPAWDKLDQAVALKNVHDEARCELRAIAEHDLLAGALKQVEDLQDPSRQTNLRIAREDVRAQARRSSIAMLIDGGSRLLSSSSSDEAYAKKALLAIEHEIYHQATSRLEQATALQAVEAAAQRFRYGRNADACRLSTYTDFEKFTSERTSSSESLACLLRIARESGVPEELLREADEQFRRADALRECLRYCDVLREESDLPQLELRNLTGLSVALDHAMRVFGSSASEDARFMMMLRYRVMLERVENVRSSIEGENGEHYDDDGELDMAKIDGELLKKQYRSAVEAVNLNVMVGGVSLPISYPGVAENSLKFRQSLGAREILQVVQQLDRLRDEDVPHDHETHEELLRDFLNGQRNPRTNQSFDVDKLRGACEAVAALNAGGRLLGQGARMMLQNALARLGRAELLHKVDIAATQSHADTLQTTLEAARDGGVPSSNLAGATKVLNRLRLKGKLESDLKLEMPPPPREAILAATVMLEEARIVDGHQAGPKTERMLDPSRTIISKAEKLRAIHEEASVDVPEVSIPRLKSALDEAEKASMSITGIRLDDKLNTPNSIKLLQHAREKLRLAQKWKATEKLSKAGEAGQKMQLEKEVQRLTNANKALERNLKNVTSDLTKAEKDNSKLESKVKELQGAMRGLGGA